MTPLGKIEAGILSGDWNTVCEGFNKLTGKKLTPPVQKAEKVVFNPEKAPKKELYSYLGKIMDLEPIKNYSLADLREMAVVHSAFSTEDLVSQTWSDTPQHAAALDKGVFLDGFRYHSGRSKLLKIDQKPVTVIVEPQLANIGDPTKEYQPREPVKHINFSCMKCKKSFSAPESRGMYIDGEAKALCPVCSETV